MTELRELDWNQSLLLELFPDKFSQIDNLLPTQLTLKGGRRVKVHYQLEQAPWIESRLQDFFGMKQGPTILNGKLPLTLHLLAPNQRAVQVTTDLTGFWERTYPELRHALSRRYPRHSWPENPLLLV
jgi:ATP-dependent helicase HrpB